MYIYAYIHVKLIHFVIQQKLTHNTVKQIYPQFFKRKAMEGLKQSYFEKYKIKTKTVFLMNLQKSRGENTSAQKLEKLSKPPSPNKLCFTFVLP